ncbi:MAG TPA: CheR family methyltransferase [Bryobacteraceae bacterium]|nr:CheR family methyltransferase [Bryobacteraceae bacterium]
MDSTKNIAQERLCHLSHAGFSKLAQYITSELGIKMPASKATLIQSRLLRRVRELGFESVERYAEFVINSPEDAEERVHLMDAITTNKTDFLREPEHFDYLMRVALPAIVEQQPKWPNRLFSVWSAGCSSGEEPYTLAMLLAEYASRTPGFDFSILATDVSTRILERARLGIYEEQQIEPLPAELRRKYLLRSRNREHRQVRVVPELRRRVSFHRLNFMDAQYTIRNTFQIIFFRNVMIYFDRPTQEVVIDKLCRHLDYGGYLFVGHSESLSGLDIPVTPVHSAVFRKMRGAVT